MSFPGDVTMEDALEGKDLPSSSVSSLAMFVEHDTFVKIPCLLCLFAMLTDWNFKEVLQ